MLKEIKQENTFMTLIKGDFRDVDYIYKHVTNMKLILKETLLQHTNKFIC